MAELYLLHPGRKIQCLRCGASWILTQASYKYNGSGIPETCAKCKKQLVLKNPLRGISLEEKFLGFVKKTNTCWLWTGACDRFGYGYLYDASYRHLRAHRLAYTLYRGKIQKGLLVCHRCDTPSCVRPDHLFLGSHTDNMRDMVKKGRHAFHQHPNTVRRGEKCAWAKLTEKQVKEIKLRFERYSPKRSNTKNLAKEFGVNPSRIQAIVNGKSWCHLA